MTASHTPRNLVRVIAAATMIAIASACAAFDSPVDPSGGAPDQLVENPSFEQDVLPVLTARCSIGGCHSFATGQGNLSLDAASAYDDLVNVQSQQNPVFWRIRPSQPDSSWMYRLIQADPDLRGGAPRMPLSSIPLTANQIGTIVNWIQQGAQRN